MRSLGSVLAIENHRLRQPHRHKGFAPTPKGAGGFQVAPDSSVSASISAQDSSFCAGSHLVPTTPSTLSLPVIEFGSDGGVLVGHRERGCGCDAPPQRRVRGPWAGSFRRGALPPITCCLAGTGDFDRHEGRGVPGPGVKFSQRPGRRAAREEFARPQTRSSSAGRGVARNGPPVTIGMPERQTNSSAGADGSAARQRRERFGLVGSCRARRRGPDRMAAAWARPAAREATATAPAPPGWPHSLPLAWVSSSWTRSEPLTGDGCLYRRERLVRSSPL